MARGIDHIVHAVHDLDAAAALYRSLGFLVGARNRHAPSWGTQNHIVQLGGGSFIEVLTVADTSRIAPHGPRTSRGIRLAALRIAVGNWDMANATLRGTGLHPRENPGKLIVGPESAMGATLVFEPLRTA
jgi:hypothetical protein